MRNLLLVVTLFLTAILLSGCDILKESSMNADRKDPSQWRLLADGIVKNIQNIDEDKDKFTLIYIEGVFPPLKIKGHHAVFLAEAKDKRFALIGTHDPITMISVIDKYLPLKDSEKAPTEPPWEVRKK